MRRVDYQEALYEAALEVGCEVRFGQKVCATDEDTPSVTLASGESVNGDIIVVADGKALGTDTFSHTNCPQALSREFDNSSSQKKMSFPSLNLCPPTELRHRSSLLWLTHPYQPCWIGQQPISG